MKINFVVWEEIKLAWENRPKEITIGTSELIEIITISLFPIACIIFMLKYIGVFK